MFHRNSDSDCHTHRNSDANGHTHRNRDRHTDSHRDAQPHSDANFHTNTNRYRWHLGRGVRWCIAGTGTHGPFHTHAGA